MVELLQLHPAVSIPFVRGDTPPGTWRTDNSPASRLALDLELLLGACWDNVLQTSSQASSFQISPDGWRRGSVMSLEKLEDVAKKKAHDLPCPVIKHSCANFGHAILRARFQAREICNLDTPAKRIRSPTMGYDWNELAIPTAEMNPTPRYCV